MAITDELREYAHDCCARVDDAIHAIADRIDAENERECHEQYACGAEHGIGVSIEASMIQDHGYIELPKDADGKVIRIGDVLDNTHKDGFAAKAVIGISYHLGGKTCVEVDENRLRWHDPSRLRHHKQPTVEDVLTEMANRIYADEDEPRNRDAIVAEYAAKLRLAESEES